MISLYQQGESVHKLARRYGCRTGVISDALADSAVRLHFGGRLHPKLTPAQERELGEVYAAGAALRTLADAYDVSVTTVRNVLKRQGVNAREAARPEFWTLKVLDRVRQLHAGGSSEQSIATELGISQVAVNRRLRSMGLLPVKVRARGAAHGAWRGGRSRNAEGYILVTPTADELPFVTPTLSGYVLEHRLVAGRFLGRPVTATETVHHINNVKTDNRIENLQIRQGAHGSGAAFQCRACGSHDVVAVPLGGS